MLPFSSRLCLWLPARTRAQDAKPDADDLRLGLLACFNNLGSLNQKSKEGDQFDFVMPGQVGEDHGLFFVSDRGTSFIPIPASKWGKRNKKGEFEFHFRFVEPKSKREVLLAGEYRPKAVSDKAGEDSSLFRVRSYAPTDSIPRPDSQAKYEPLKAEEAKGAAVTTAMDGFQKHIITTMNDAHDSVTTVLEPFGLERLDLDNKWRTSYLEATGIDPEDKTKDLNDYNFGVELAGKYGDKDLIRRTVSAQNRGIKRLNDGLNPCERCADPKVAEEATKLRDSLFSIYKLNNRDATRHHVERRIKDLIPKLWSGTDADGKKIIGPYTDDQKKDPPAMGRRIRGLFQELILEGRKIKTAADTVERNAGEKPDELKANHKPLNPASVPTFRRKDEKKADDPVPPTE